MELRDIVRPVLQKMANGMGMQRGTITIINRDTRQISIEEAEGLTAHERENHYLLAGNVVVETVIRTGQPVICTDLASDDTFEGKLPLRVIEAAQSGRRIALICVPIKLGEEVIGTLSVEREMEGQPNLAADRRLLSLIANLVAQAVRLRQTAQEKVNALRQENERLQEQIENYCKPPQMVGSSSAMKTVYRHIATVADSRTTVLIRGESGVGKELVAAAVHQQSARRSKAFVKFNCAALPESVIESELFGHEKGAFTGALTMRLGRFEVANGGTIFLDEIGDLSPATQVKLLRVLQERQFERVGSHTPIACDIRVIAATSRNLESMIEAHQFRPDLYYRLNVFPIYVPSLRERRTDILELANHFVEKFSRLNEKSVRRISTAAIDMLMAYHWPGNVRELENCMERAALLCQGDSILAQHLPSTLQLDQPGETKGSGSLESAISAMEYEMLVSQLKQCHGNMTLAAKNLGITERIMGLRVKKYRIDVDRFRAARQPNEKSAEGIPCG